MPPVITDALSTPALAGQNLIFGDAVGEYALNALTGALVWQYNSGGDYVNSSAAVVGPVGSRVAVLGTLNGKVDVLDVGTGALRYQYQTGSYITSSPADVDGNLIIGSGDGYLYDFALGGGNGAHPTTAVTSPTAGAVLPNPSGSVVISGTATAPNGVSAVTVAVQENGTSGPWFNPGTGTFTPGLAFARANVASPGATTSNWSFALPVPPQGGSFEVFAGAVDTDGIADLSPESSSPGTSTSSFSVQPAPGVPQLNSPNPRVAPATPLSISATGFAPLEAVTFTVPVRRRPPSPWAPSPPTSPGSWPRPSSRCPARCPSGRPR